MLQFMADSTEPHRQIAESSSARIYLSDPFLPSNSEFVGEAHQQPQGAWLQQEEVVSQQVPQALSQGGSLRHSLSSLGQPQPVLPTQGWAQLGMSPYEPLQPGLPEDVPPFRSQYLLEQAQQEWCQRQSPSQSCKLKTRNGQQHRPQRVLLRLRESYIPDAWIQNPKTTTWLTASECQLVIALFEYIRTWDNPPFIWDDGWKENSARINGHTFAMYDEIVKYIRDTYQFPWSTWRLGTEDLVKFIKGNDHMPTRRLFKNVRDAEAYFWRDRVIAAFQAWVFNQSPLCQR